MASSRSSRTTFVTERQAVVHALFIKHRSMSVVARMMGVSAITVRETLVQYQRNVLRDQGVKPPSLKTMLRGDVIARFGISRVEAGGRPPKHEQVDPRRNTEILPAAAAQPRSISNTTGRTMRFIVTAMESGKRIHSGFWCNLMAYGHYLGAELMVMRMGGQEPARAEANHPEIACFLLRDVVEIGLQVDVATDVRLPMGNTRPLTSTQDRSNAVWTIFRHPAIQLETLARIRADGLRIQMTSGAITVRHRACGAGAGDVGAVIVEIGADGISHCRHIVSSAVGDGSFQDLTNRVVDGAVAADCRIEALNFGDVHHAFIDPDVVRATWGLGGKPEGAGALVDRLAPSRQIFHDLCDFAARSPFAARDHLKRFAQHSAGEGNVREEFLQVADFLSATSRKWCESVVVHSNHDEMLVRWLREADFREDPINALFFLEYSLALHRRLDRGEDTEGLFEMVVRNLSPDGLAGVRFLKDGESLKVADIEVAIHGHKGTDGRIGGMQALDRLGIRATIGHTHRPTTRDQLYSAGVCQTELAYAKGALTAWAVGHVATYWNGSRQHLIFHGGRFHA